MTRVDRRARRILIEKAVTILERGNRLCAVTLEEFFEGNTDQKSIGVNLPADKHIGLDGFRRVLYDIRNRLDVQEVFIELHEIPDLENKDEDDFWPIGWVVFIITTVPLTTVSDWVAPLLPRDVSEGWNVPPHVHTPLADSDLRDGMRPVRVWLG